MSEQLVMPKFLTLEMAKTVVNEVLCLAMGNMSIIAPYLKRRMCHIVVLVPAMKDDRAADYPNWPNYSLQPAVLYEHSLGKPGEWPHQFDDIARCKALQLWHDRNEGATDVMPHLLFPGDTPYWGGVKRNGLVVACSGVQPWFDRMIAGMVADGLIAMAYEHWMHGNDKKNGVDFIS